MYVKVERFLLNVQILALKAAIQFKTHFSTIRTVVAALALVFAIAWGAYAEHQ
jgi:hypothetical protein